MNKGGNSSIYDQFSIYDQHMDPTSSELEGGRVAMNSLATESSEDSQTGDTRQNKHWCHS